MIADEEDKEIREAVKEVLGDLGVSIVSCGVEPVAGANYTRVVASMEIHCLSRRPHDPRAVVAMIGEHISPRPSLGSEVVVNVHLSEAGLPTPTRATVHGVNTNAHTFVCKDSEGHDLGPYRFGDMLRTWRKV